VLKLLFDLEYVSASIKRLERFGLVILALRPPDSDVGGDRARRDHHGRQNPAPILVGDKRKVAGEGGYTRAPAAGSRRDDDSLAWEQEGSVELDRNSCRARCELMRTALRPSARFGELTEPHEEVRRVGTAAQAAAKAPQAAGRHMDAGQLVVPSPLRRGGEVPHEGPDSGSSTAPEEVSTQSLPRRVRSHQPNG